MGRIYHPAYTRAMPAGAKVRVVDGRRVVDLVIAGQRRTCEVNERGRVTVVLEDRWAVEWTDESGKTRARTIGKDKRTATAALARYEERAARIRHGLPDPREEASIRTQPLMLAVRDYLEVLAGQDTSAEYRQHVDSRMKSILTGCRWETWLDVTADSFTRFLGRLRDNDDLSLSTLNGYMRNAKGFCNWFAEKLQARSPLHGLKPYPEDKSRKRSRRILTDAEFDRLIEATLRAPRRHGVIIRPVDRAMLYQVAAYSGLRASELSRLTPASIDLGPDPGIRVYGKGKREEFTPIPAHLADLLRPWIAGKKPTAQLWPGRWAAQKRQCQFLARDVKRAGLGDGVTFHSLRRRYVTGLLRAGNAPDVVRRLARHRDLKTTMDYYAELTPADLRAGAESLKPPRAG